MIDLSTVSAGDWIALYAAALSSLMAAVAAWRFIAQKLHRRREFRKFKTDLYFLQKVDRATQKVHPIVVVLLANLGTERLSFKSLQYEGIATNGGKTHGEAGWYEQPEELYGIRNRLLPRTLDGGHTADLPIVEIGVISRIRDLKMWLTDFDDHRYYIEDRDIARVRNEVEKYLEASKLKTG